MPKTPRPTSAIAAALAGKRRQARHTKLYLWMREHYDELKAAKGSNRSDWKAAAEELAKLGLTVRNDKPPTAQTARMTWARVAREEEALRASQARGEKAAPPVASQTKPALPADEPDDESAPRYVFTPVRKKDAPN